MVTQLYNKSYFTWLGEWMNAPTHCIARVLELCEQLTPIEDYFAFKNGTSTDNDVTCRLLLSKVHGKTTLQRRCQWEPMRAVWLVNIKVKNMNLSNHPNNLFILISPKKIVEKVSFSSVNVCCVICPLGSALCIKWMVKVPLSAFKFNWTRYDTDTFYVKARFNYWKFPLRKSKFYFRDGYYLVALEQLKPHTFNFQFITL